MQHSPLILITLPSYPCNPNIHPVTLPPRWREDEWQLDIEALEREGVDEQGWTYALDFNYLKHPPPQGSGKYVGFGDSMHTTSCSPGPVRA